MRRALVVLGLSLALDFVFGIWFAAVEHISAWNGLYFATTTASTVGYGDITPQGWRGHLLAVAIMLTVIPLFSAVFSLLTTALTTKHVDLRHAELKRHIDVRHAELKKRAEEVHNGGPDGNPDLDSQPGGGERDSGAEHVGGVPGHDQPADVPGDAG
jgi:hypothetical protein